MRPLTGAEVCKILAREGFTKVRQRGGHAIMQKPVDRSTVTVPVPIHNKELKRGTLASIIRQSGLQRAAFEK